MESTKAVQPDSENETRVECAQCGLSTKLSLSVRDLPMDPLIALYSAVPSQVFRMKMWKDRELNQMGAFSGACFLEI